MAMIQCHECGNGVSTKAKQCPSCGAKVKKPVGIFGIIFAAFFAFILFSTIFASKERAEAEDKRIAQMTPEQRKAEDEKKKEQAKKDDAALLCLISAKASLKDPDSAKFPTHSHVVVQKLKNGGYRAQFEGSAKNSFGAYTRSVFDCKTAPQANGQQKLVSIKEIN